MEGKGASGDEHPCSLIDCDGENCTRSAGAPSNRTRVPSHSHTLRPELEPFRSFWKATKDVSPDQEISDEQAVAYLRQHGFSDPKISEILAKCEEKALARKIGARKKGSCARTRARRPSVSSALCLLGDETSEVEHEPSGNLESGQQHRQSSSSSLTSTSNSSTATSFSPCASPQRADHDSSASPSSQSPRFSLCTVEDAAGGSSLPPPFPGYTRVCLNLK